MYEQISANRRKTTILVTLFLIILIALGWALSVYFESSAILVAAVGVSVAMSWWSYFRGDKAILALSGAKPIEPDKNLDHRKILHLVENLCIATGLPQPEVFIINDPAPNAFATGRNPKNSSIALTSGLISKLDKAELEGVIAHELSHIQNYDILLSTVVVTLVGAIVLVSDWALRAHFYRGNRNSGGGIILVVAIVLAILSPILARLIYLAISRRREYLADASGALMTRYPEGLASALKKISADENELKRANRATAGLYIANPFKKIGRGMGELLSTHPPIEKRITALNNMNV